MKKFNWTHFLLILGAVSILYMGISSILDGTFKLFLESLLEVFFKYFAGFLILSIASAIYACIQFRGEIKHFFSWKVSFFIVLFLLILMSIFSIFQIFVTVDLQNKYTKLDTEYSKYRASMEGNYSGWTLEEIQELFNGKK